MKAATRATIAVKGTVYYEGRIHQIGGGGTKTAYQLHDSNLVVLLPNEVDGDRLVKQFPRICEEEEIMANYLKAHGLYCLPVSTCQVTLDTGVDHVGLLAPSFHSFKKDGIHVIDCKNILRTHWDPNLITVPEDDPKAWRPVFAPLVQDLKTLCAAGVYPAGDGYNLCIVDGTVRYFGFDQTSKVYLNSVVLALQNHERVQPIRDRDVMEQAIQTAVEVVFIIFSPRYDALTNVVSDLIKSML